MASSRWLAALLISSAFSFETFAATITWTNAAGDGRWQNPGNWSSGTVPTDIDYVVLPSGAGTITLEGYCHGISIALDGNVVFNVPDTVPADWAGFNAQVSPNQITGASTSSIEKRGAGALRICASGFDGKFIFSQGSVTASEVGGGESSGCLGSTVGDTEVDSGATLSLKLSYGSLQEPVVLRGGTLEVFGGSSYMPITIMSDSYIGMDGTWQYGSIDGPGHLLYAPGTDFNVSLGSYDGVHSYSFASPLIVPAGRTLSLDNALMPGIDILADGASVFLSGMTTTGALSVKNGRLSGSAVVQDFNLSGSGLYLPFDPIEASGSVNVTDATFSYLPSPADAHPGQIIPIINNNGPDPVIGRFTTRSDASAASYLDRPNGARATTAGTHKRIFFNGGDGNDVVEKIEAVRRLYHAYQAGVPGCYVCSDVYFQDPLGGVGVWIMTGTSVMNGLHLGDLGTDYDIVAIGDLDGDGRADIVVRHKITGAVGVWFATGGGALISNLSADYDVVGSEDLDGDGKWDLIVRCKSTNAIGVWLMNGAWIASGGYIGQLEDYDVAALDDFDGDGKGDILLRNRVTGDVAVWFLDGTTLRSGSVIGPLSFDYSIAGTGDLDGDGRADIILRYEPKQQLGAWYIDGSTIRDGVYLGVLGADEYVVRTDDFDGDAWDEVMIRNSVTGTVRYLKVAPDKKVTSFPVIGTLPPIYDTIP